LIFYFFSSKILIFFYFTREHVRDNALSLNTIICFHRGSESMISQAREWESSGEYARAVECYLKVTQELTNDRELLVKCWLKVRQLGLFKE